MSRPKKPRLCGCFKNCACSFEPQGVSLCGKKEISLYPDEMEAIKLHDLDGLEQKSAAEKMGISQSTFGRILKIAREKIASGLVENKSIKIVKG